MKPVEFPEQNQIIAKDQPEYKPLPAHIAQNPQGEIITCWKLSFRERLSLLFSGRLWLSVWTFHRPLQPLFLTTDKWSIFQRPTKKYGSPYRPFKNIRVYGGNAMHYAIQISTRRYGYITFRIFTRSPDIHPIMLYCSPNATPWACTFYFGPDRDERLRARIRKLNFGHNFSTDRYGRELRALNEKFSRFWVSEHDVERYHK
ncbi:hypothetical protein [Salmonirosea aquatica]|uniref:Uncharacterized protein n=1 Tax=Salmonirosea aquatica TaxID=2654236 RepID=A0A7C9BDW5_9BACT|nr:hypothetical protein [Cytophagaceae bacterium SJW1-29]